MDFQLSGIQSKSKNNHQKKSIDLLNVVYDEEFVSLINSLSSYIKNFYSISLNIIKDLYNNSLMIDNNSIYSKCLINEIKYNTKEKIKQLSEKIDSICNTKKIIEKNILLIDSNLSKFYNDSKKIFKNLKTIRNSKINYAIDTSINYDGNNSMTNFKTSFEKEDLLLNKNDKDNYYRNRNNSICYDSEKLLSNSRFYNRNILIPISRKNSEMRRRYNLKLNYFNNYNQNKNNSYNNKLKLRNKLINNRKNNSSENIFSSAIKNTVINNNYKNMVKNSLEYSPEMFRTKSSFNNFYINQNSNVNLSDDNYINNLELSYKVIEFLSLLSNISKKNSSNNPYISKTIQKFEETKKNLFELSKKFIEQNNKKDINNRLFQNYNFQNNQRNKTRKDLQLILMNNNITNIRKEIEYKELIDKINYLSSSINNLEKENQKLKNISNTTKKELSNNNILLSKKNKQLILFKKEKTDFISQINMLQKDNESLMELIHDKNKTNKKNDKNDELIIEEKDNIIKELNNQIKEIKKNNEKMLKDKNNELKKNYENKIIDKNNEIKNLNSKISELNNSLKNMDNIIKEKEIIINKLKKNEIKENNIDKNFNINQLIYDKIEDLAFIAKSKKIKGGNLTKYKFTFDELIFEQIERLSCVNKKENKNKNNNPINFDNFDDNKKIVENLENEIKELKNNINEKENEIQKYKNENSILKSFVDNNKNKKKEEEEIKEKNNNYKEEINKLKMENKEITEEKNNIVKDYEKLFLDNKNLEINILSKDEEIHKLQDIIKELEEQIKEKDIQYINNINNEQNNEDIEFRTQNKINTNNNNVIDINTHNEIVSQFKDDLKEKDNEIELLKIEIQEMKSKIEEYEENFNNSSFKQNNEVTNNYEEKIKFLTERKDYYQKLFNENKIKLQNLEISNKNLKNENEELKKIKNMADDNHFSNNLMLVKNNLLSKENEDKNTKKIYNAENYIILGHKDYHDLKWYLLASKNISNNRELSEDTINYTYDDLIWVPKTNIEDINKFNDYQSNEEDKKDEKEEEKYSRKLNKIEITKEKEISFSSNVNNFSFHNNSEDYNKNKGNIINNISPNSKRGSFFSLGNNNNINEDNNDYNKLFEKFKNVLEKLNKTEEKYMKLQKKNIELREKIKKSNKSNGNLMKISLSDDSNDFSNGISNGDMGKLSIIEHNFDGENDAFGKLNMNKNIREHEYYESALNELEATKNQLNLVKQVLKELEKKFETIKQICENLFSKLTLKKKEKEEFKILLKIMDFTDEKISLIIDKKKK